MKNSNDAIGNRKHDVKTFLFAIRPVGAMLTVRTGEG
jgi:hypothetical protein